MPIFTGVFSLPLFMAFLYFERKMLSMENFLYGKSEIRVLGIISLERELNVSSLARKAGLEYKTTNKIVDKLVKQWLCY